MLEKRSRRCVRAVAWRSRYSATAMRFWLRGDGGGVGGACGIILLALGFLRSGGGEGVGSLRGRRARGLGVGGGSSAVATVWTSAASGEFGVSGGSTSAGGSASAGTSTTGSGVAFGLFFAPGGRPLPRFGRGVSGASTASCVASAASCVAGSNSIGMFFIKGGILIKTYFETNCTTT